MIHAKRSIISILMILMLFPDMTGAQTLEDMTGAETLEDMTGAQTLEHMTGAQTLEDMTGAEVLEDIPGEEPVFNMDDTYADETGDTAKAKELHVSANGSDTEGDGTKASPFATVERALKDVKPGTRIFIHKGEYKSIEAGPASSGQPGKSVVIKAYKNDKVVIRPEVSDKYGDAVGIRMINAHDITIEGLEVKGGTIGISYESTRAAGEKTLENITVRDCIVHGVRGVHGICFYGRNDLAPVKNAVMTGCHVYDCRCGDSEATVFNGNIDGFKITENKIHDNDNIGIDMIGFEGTAKHKKKKGGNPYSVDFVRNGTCSRNTVYNISTEGNSAYLHDGRYVLCAGGIYVDGGQDIEIYDNFVYDSDIGIEVATEHKPSDNRLFKVSGINVHDNVIADCRGWCGMCFGGYDAERGFTEKCSFNNNTLIGNAIQLVVQRSRENVFSRNICIGSRGVEYNTDCRPEDMVNDIGDNIAAGIKDKDTWSEDYGICHDSPAAVVKGLRSLVEGYGSSFVPVDNRDKKDYRIPFATMRSSGSNKMSISWQKVSGAKGYDIFLSKCGGDENKRPDKKVKTINNNNKFTYTATGLKKATSYKAAVKAFIYINGKKKYVSQSPIVHAYTSGGNKRYTNAKSLTVDRKSRVLRVGGSARIHAKVTGCDKKKKLMASSHVKKIRYLCSDGRIASVTGKGVITGKKKGSCNILVYAHNGVYKKVKVTVK